MSVITDIFSSVSALLFGPQISQSSLLSQLEKDFGLIHPSFFAGSLQDALSYSHQSRRTLCAYLHSSEHQDTPSFCKNVIFTEEFQNLINENFFFWVADIESQEGVDARSFFKAGTFPFLCFIRHEADQTVPLMLVRGAVSLEELSRNILNLIEFSSIENDQIDQEDSRSLRELQDLEYLEAMEADQQFLNEEGERASAQRDIDLEAMQRAEEAERERLIKEEQQRLLEQERKKTLESKKERVKEEPVPGSPGCITIQFQLPSGAKIRRRFLPSSVSSDLYNFVDISQEELRPGEYEIASSVPPCSLPLSDSLSLSSAGFLKSCSVFVNKKN